MYASLAMYSRAHQDISKRDRYIGHVRGRTRREIDKRQKAVVAYSAWVYVRWASLAFSLFSFILLFYYNNIVASCYHSFPFLFYSILIINIHL